MSVPQVNTDEKVSDGEEIPCSSQSCRRDSSSALLAEEKMRRRLQFFFMNPIEKWQARRRFPYKFVVQVIKIFLVTLQLCLFAYSRYKHVNYTWDNRVSFSHLFLAGWDPMREINAYPPPAGPLALYKKDDFFSTIDYACKGYANLGDAIGSYSYANEDNTMTDPVFCIFKYKQGVIDGFNESYVFDSKIEKFCLNITYNSSEPFNSKEYLKKNNFSVDFSSLVHADLKFSVKTINFKAAGPITPPDCYEFKVNIHFDNEDHDGQMELSLDAEPIRLECQGSKEYIIDNTLDTVLRSILNYLVVVTCVVSFVLCQRALIRAQRLKNVTIKFFKTHYNRTLSPEGRMEFLDLWYVMIIVNDVLIIIGSLIKEQIEKKQFLSDHWNAGSIFLGTGAMLVWFGVLRYLGFFKTYNVVILTLKKATPKVLRFLLCALLIYAGFTFGGWLILGPYHMKFRSLSTTSECLFSLINGDDMFATFSIMTPKSTMLWWYSRVYLYSFISLYIYVVLSLFISVIMDAYDTIKLYYNEGFPKNDLQQFIGNLTVDDLSSGIYRTDSNSHFSLKELCCCCAKIQKSYSTLRESRTNLKNDNSNADCV